ncbi:MAG TPA: glycoside hydrolase family 2 TIM barrel-domain containing protein, partial [Roseiflexaceae bacterium]|nr:glycoside hydrolase family 2 TIM barrel-domain containing protein [Roseiflexaceae bacterium]
GPLSGIWQSVYVEARPALAIAALEVTPDARNGNVGVKVTLEGAVSSDARVVLTLLDPDGMQVTSGEVTAGGAEAETTLSVSALTRWDIDNPALYSLLAEVQYQGERDQVRKRFGFRTFEARDGSLWLNDRPLMLRGALDQDYYPGLIATPPSYEFLVQQAQLAKRMGLNCLRCHIKVADPRYLEAADEVGLLVWAELPNWQYWTPAGGARGVETLKQAIARDWHHPSVVIWTVINESWGIDQTNPEHRAWLLAAFEEVKGFAGDRLVVDNSACFNNFHLKSDLDDYHFYAAMPDERAVWSEWVRQFANRAVWSYGAEQLQLPTGVRNRWQHENGYGAVLPEVERSGDEPLIVSEFGNWGLPSLASLRVGTGQDPWWFETGDDWGDGVVYPHGVDTRFQRLGLAHIFGDYEQFAHATRRSEFDALQFEIEEMRRYPAISGYVITEFTDVHWECNGLLDMQRAPKMPLDALAALNADTVLVLDRSQGAWRTGEQRAI